MRGKLLFAAGLAAGYVIGARAGRPAYDALTARFDDVASSPQVRRAASDAKATLEEKAPGVAGALEQAAQTVTETAAAVQEAPSGQGAPAKPTGSRRVRSSGGAPAKADV